MQFPLHVATTEDARPVAIARFVDARRVRQIVVLSPSSLSRLEKCGLFPKRYHLGPARIAWSHADIVGWMQAKVDARGPCPFSGAIGALTLVDRFVSKTELRELVVYSPQHIRLLEQSGKFPKRIWIGEKRVVWLEREVIAWMSSRTSTTAIRD